MRIFSDAIEMYKEVKRDLWEMGTTYFSATVQDKKAIDDKDLKTKELTGYAYMLTSFNRLNDLIAEDIVGNKREWILAEAIERVSDSPGPRNPGEAWKLDRDFWAQFLHEGGFSYSYWERWSEQLPFVIEELKTNPNTRQAMITMYDTCKDLKKWGGKARVPCSLTYQFLLREDELVVIYNQRSCDFIKFFPADVYFTAKLLEHVAEKIGKRPGKLIHFLGSLHIFADDVKDEHIF